jgi:hypothetical protein
MAPPDLALKRYTIDYRHRRQQQASGLLHVWSSVLRFDNPLTPEMLDYVCYLAYNQMSDEHDALGLDKENKPATVAAMMGPGKSVVIISSSMKKVYGAGTAGRYYYQNPNLKALLDAAIPEGAEPHQQKHRTGGCAEIGCLSDSLCLGKAVFHCQNLHLR